MGAGIAGSGSVVKDPTPTAGGGKDNDSFTSGKASNSGIGGTGTTSDVQRPGACADRSCAAWNGRYVVTMTIAVFVLTVFHVPPGTRPGNKCHIGSFLQSCDNSRPGGTTFTHIQFAAGCRHDSGFGMKGSCMNLWRYQQDPHQNDCR